MLATTTPRTIDGHHCAQVNRRRFGRATGSRTASATNCRTTTTPAGPIVPNACAPTAAPTWLLVAAVSIVPTPASVRPLPMARVWFARPASGNAPAAYLYAARMTEPAGSGGRGAEPAGSGGRGAEPAGSGGRGADLRLHQMRALVAVLDTGTFTDAASTLGVSQAAVSRAVAGLEAALGVRLLQRTSRHVTLTSTGARVVERVRLILD